MRRRVNAFHCCFIKNKWEICFISVGDSNNPIKLHTVNECDSETISNLKIPNM